MASRAPVRLPSWVEQLLDLVHVDWQPSTRQPTTRRLALATALSIAGSLVADAVLVALGTHVFPSTRGFSHFRFGDYASLTVVGVLIACAGWPIATRISSTPRWLFFRLAVAVTLVLFLPDAWLLLRGETPTGVAVLMVMHLAIALVTYNCLVDVAPAGRRRRRGTAPGGLGGGREAGVPVARTTIGATVEPPSPSQSPLAVAAAPGSPASRAVTTAPSPAGAPGPTLSLIHI